MKILIKVISYIALALTIIPSFLVFNGTSTLETNKMLMLIGTIIWFVTAPIWMNKAE
jgi:hypothetical protein